MPRSPAGRLTLPERERRWQEGVQRTRVALRFFSPAVLLADFHQKCMEFVIESWIGGQMRMEESLSLGITRTGPKQSVTGQNAPCVSVGHEEWLPGGIEQDDVHSLGPEPPDPEQFPTSLFGLKGKQPRQ